MAKTWQKLRLITLQFTDVDPEQAVSCQFENAIVAALAALLTRARTHPRAQKIAVAYSGGLDSTVLLHALAQLEKGAFEAIHVEHGLHPDSALWAAYCIDFAQQLGVDATQLSVKVKNTGSGIEDAARRARYQAIAAHTGPDVLLLTAHHSGDQAETVLMKLLGGAGPRGVAGMQALSVRREFLLARPLLGITKAQIKAYAKRHGLRWIEDPSNQSQKFRRNQIRQLMPEIIAIYPDAQLTLAAHAELAGNDRNLLESHAQQALARCQSLDPTVLRLACLRAEPTALRPWILRTWLAELGVHSPALVKASMALASDSAEFGEVKTKAQRSAIGTRTTANDCVRRYDNCLYYSLEVDNQMAALPITPMLWHAHAPLSMGEFGTLSFDAHSSAVAESIWMISRRQGGERIQLPARLRSGKPHRHALKDILQQQRVPPWQRNRLILLHFPDTGDLACVVGVCASARFQDWLNTHGTRLVHNN